MVREAAWLRLQVAYPGRGAQIATLATLLDPSLALPKTLVVHGTEATGKSAVLAAVLAELGRDDDGDSDHDDDATRTARMDHAVDYAIVDSNKCVTGRHLFERTLAQTAAALQTPGPGGLPGRRCETLAQLAVELQRLVAEDPRRHPRRHVVLVFDSVDRQRDAPATLLLGLARLPEMVCEEKRETSTRMDTTDHQIPRLTIVFVVTAPPPAMLRTAATPHVHFSNYAKADFVAIVRRSPPWAAKDGTAASSDHANATDNDASPFPNASAAEATDLWARFCAAVHDALARSAARSLVAYRDVCLTLWPRFVAPIIAGTHGPRELSKLLIAARAHFQDEALLDPPLVSAPAATPVASTDARHLAALLPATPRLLLLCAYLASHNASKHDLTLFSTHHHGRKRRRHGFGARSGPRSKHRKIARKLLGAHSFSLERLLAIVAAVRSEWTPASSASSALLDGDGLTAWATLAALRLVVRVGAAGGCDLLDRAAKWRVNVGWEVVRSLGRSMGVEMEEWLID